MPYTQQAARRGTKKAVEISLQQRLPLNNPDIAPYTEELRASLQHRMSGSGKVQATHNQLPGVMPPATAAPPPQGSSSTPKRQRHRLEAPPNLPSAWDVLAVRHLLSSEVIHFWSRLSLARCLCLLVGKGMHWTCKQTMISRSISARKINVTARQS